ncbi:MAG: hypothetical protein ACLQPH_06685 [Acidimicrobiales bacterium]
MIRKLLLVAAAAAMPVGMIAATGGIASAKAPPVDATHATISCTTISGSATFVPPVTADESAGSASIKIKAKVSGCTTNDGVTVVSGGATGTLTTTRTAGENGCTALAGGSLATGALTTKWKSTPALSSGSSVINVNSIAGSVLGNGNAGFNIPGTVPNGAPSGSFQGTDAGAGDMTSAQTTLPALTLLANCDKKGLKSIKITSPPSGAAVSLS